MDGPPPPPPSEPPPDKLKKKSKGASGPQPQPQPPEAAGGGAGPHSARSDGARQVDEAGGVGAPLIAPLPSLKDAVPMTGGIPPQALPQSVPAHDAQVGVSHFSVGQHEPDALGRVHKVLTWPCTSQYVGLVNPAGEFVRGKMQWGEFSPNKGQSYDGDWVKGTMHGKGTYAWPDGRVYNGDWVSGKFSGFGTLKEANGSQYTGQFAQNKPHGQGRKKWASGASAGCAYQGQWVSGQMEGLGTYTWPNGDVYTGEWLNGKRSGQGKLVFNSGNCQGDCFEGQFAGGKFHGEGVYRWANGDVFVGSWVEGRRSGQGTLKHGAASPNAGEVYEGSWEDNRLDGFGIYHWPDGSLYEGQWKNGMREGFGVRTWANGSQYSGWWAKHQIEGRGVFTDANGGLYEGEWKEGKPHGKGRKIWVMGESAGHVYEGEWMEGIHHGSGTYTWADGSRYDGEFFNGRCNGMGVMRWNSHELSGDVYKGEWKNDQMHGSGKYTDGRSGDVIEGQWHHGTRHGKALHWVRESGVTWEEEWERGRLHAMRQKVGERPHGLKRTGWSEVIRKKESELENALHQSAAHNEERASHLPMDVLAAASGPPKPSEVFESPRMVQEPPDEEEEEEEEAENLALEPSGGGDDSGSAMGDAAEGKAAMLRENSEASSGAGEQRPRRLTTSQSLRSIGRPAPFLKRTTTTARLRRRGMGEGLKPEQCVSVRRSLEDFLGLDLPSPGECARRIQRHHRGLHLVQMIVKGYDEAKEGEFRREHRELQDLKETIMFEARGNHLLDKELDELERKIALLVANRISVQQIIAESSGLLREVDKRAGTDSGVHLKDRKAPYTRFLELLLANPDYIIALCNVVDPKQVEGLVYTIAETLYADHYDVRIERQLLGVIQSLVDAEFANSSSMGTLMRGNTVVTKMLAAYCRRGEGHQLLRRVLGPNVKALCESSVVLEMNPVKVYQQLLSQQEKETGTPRNVNYEVSLEEAAGNAIVASEMGRRAEQLKTYSARFLYGLVDSVADIPFGMRWIASRIFANAKKRFPLEDTRKINCLVGGFIFLRYFNPGLCTPDSLQVVDFQCTSAQRRNLILIAKLIQNLSNDVVFGAKESFMQDFNAFLEDNTNKLQDFFAELVDVSELDQHMQLESKFVAVPGILPTNEAHLVSINLNELFLLHRLCAQHVDHVTKGASDPLRAVLNDLGPAPAPLSRDRDCPVCMRVPPPDIKSGPQESEELEKAYAHLKALVIDVMREVPITFNFTVASNRPPSSSFPSSERESSARDVENFNLLLKHPEPLSCLRRDMEETYCSENIDFYFAVSSLIRQHHATTHVPPEEGSRPYAMSRSRLEVLEHAAPPRESIVFLYDTFVKEGSPQQVNLGFANSQNLIREIEANLAMPEESFDLANVDMAPFLQAREEIRLLMEKDCFRQRFLKNPKYLQRWRAYLDRDEGEYCFSRALKDNIDQAEQALDWELADDLELLAQAVGDVAWLMGDEKRLDGPVPFSDVFDCLSKDIAMFAKVIDNVKRHVTTAREVLEEVRKRQLDLVDRVEYYAQYLENVRTRNLFAHTPDVENNQGMVMHRVPYAQLEAKHVITASSLHRDLRKKMVIVFVSEDGSQFEVTALFKKLTVQKSYLLLEDLLEMSDVGQRTLALQDIQFDVNLLLHLLNHKLVAQVQKKALNTNLAVRLQQIRLQQP